jgi:hypothetical protein
MLLMRGIFFNLLAPIALYPDFASREVFLLPDGHTGFEAIDRFGTRVEGRLTMGRGDDNHNTRFTDREPPQTMHDRHFADRVLRSQLTAQLFHEAQRHGFIAFVFKKFGRASLGVISNDALECGHRSVRRTLHQTHQSARVNRIACERYKRAATAANRRQKSDLIAGLDPRLEGRELVIPRGANMRAMRSQTRKTGREIIPDRTQRSRLGSVEIMGGEPGRVLQLAEEKDVYLHGRGQV